MNDLDNIRLGPLPRQMIKTQDLLKQLEDAKAEMKIKEMGDLARNLKEIREFLGISQTELGRRCGMSAAHISHFETQNREPNIHNLVKLAKGLGITVDRLLQEAK